MAQIVVISIIVVVIIFLLSWRLFSKIGGKVQKEVNKIKQEISKGDKKDE